MSIFITKADRSGKDSYDLTSYLFAEKRKIQLLEKIDCINAMTIAYQLEYLDSIGDDNIHLYINSPGGSVSAGLAIVDAINRCKCDVVTICTGISASMAAVIASCGTKGKRYITPFAEIMIHQPHGAASGQCSDIERKAAHIGQLKHRITEILVKNTGKTAKVITAACDRDTYLSAEEAISFGLADKILSTNIF